MKKPSTCINSIVSAFWWKTLIFFSQKYVGDVPEIWTYEEREGEKCLK
jgi:hypothetical protein